MSNFRPLCMLGNSDELAKKHSLTVQFKNIFGSMAPYIVSRCNSWDSLLTPTYMWPQLSMFTTTPHACLITRLGLEEFLYQCLLMCIYFVSSHVLALNTQYRTVGYTDFYIKYRSFKYQCRSWYVVYIFCIFPPTSSKYSMGLSIGLYRVYWFYIKYRSFKYQCLDM